MPRSPACPLVYLGFLITTKDEGSRRKTSLDFTHDRA